MVDTVLHPSIRHTGVSRYVPATMLRTCLLSLLVIVLHAADSPDRRIIAALDALAAAKDATAIHLATNELLNSAPMDNQTIENATWVALGKRYLPLAKKIPLWERITVADRLVRGAPSAHRPAAISWTLDACTAALDLAEKEREGPSLERLTFALERLLPKEGEAPARSRGVPYYDLHQHWVEDFAAFYSPLSKRLESVAESWKPSRHPEFGMSLARAVRSHAACTPLIRILLKRSADSGSREILSRALGLLKHCQEPVPEAPIIVSRAAGLLKQDLVISGNVLRLWRGDPIIGAALMPLMLAPGDKDFARSLAEEPSHDRTSLWRVVLPPAAERRALVKRTVDGLEAGLEVPTSALTVQLVLHILDFPDGYAEVSDADLQRRLTALLSGPNDMVRLMAFNLIGHLAGREGIDAAYAIALPQVHDLLMPESPGEQRLRGIPQDRRWMFREVSGLLAATRLRLTLCHLPLTGPDRARVYAWRGVENDTLPVAAWLVRTAAPGEHPLAGVVDRPTTWFLGAWPRWAEPEKRTDRTPPDWRKNFGDGLIYLRDVPDWAEGPAVIDATLNDPGELGRLISFISDDEEENTKALRRALHSHPGLRAFAEKNTAVLEKQGPPSAAVEGNERTLIDAWSLAMLWGHVLGQPERAAALLALRYPENLGNAGFNPGVTLLLADIARWSPNHPLLDSQEQRWRSQLPIAPRRAFQIWCLAVLRGRDPGVFPAAAWLDHLLFKDGSDFTFHVMKRHSALFARHLGVLRTPCPPRMPELDSLAIALARVQAAADSAP